MYVYLVLTVCMHYICVNSSMLLRDSTTCRWLSSQTFWLCNHKLFKCYSILRSCNVQTRGIILQISRRRHAHLGHEFWPIFSPLFLHWICIWMILSVDEMHPSFLHCSLCTYRHAHVSVPQEISQKYKQLCKDLVDIGKLASKQMVECNSGTFCPSFWRSWLFCTLKIHFFSDFFQEIGKWMICIWTR